VLTRLDHYASACSTRLRCDGQLKQGRKRWIMVGTVVQSAAAAAVGSPSARASNHRRARTIVQLVADFERHGADMSRTKLESGESPILRIGVSGRCMTRGGTRLGQAGIPTIGLQPAVVRLRRSPAAGAGRAADSRDARTKR